MVKTDTKVWNRLPRQGDCPPAACCESMVTHQTQLILFGGAILSRLFNDVHIFDTTTFSWEKPFISNPELSLPRMSHSAVVYNNVMYVFGGMDATSISNELISLCLTKEKMRWYFPNGSIRYNEDATSGNNHPTTLRSFYSDRYPCPRRCHTAVVRRHHMYVLMGHGQDGNCNDFWCFSFETGHWSAIPLSAFGRPPLPLYGHSAAVVEAEDVMYVFGGAISSTVHSNSLHSYHFATQQWNEVQCPLLPRPVGRYCHCMAIVNGTLYIHGGDAMDSTLYFNDLWSIQTQRHQHQAVQEHLHSSSTAWQPSVSEWVEVAPTRRSLVPSERSGHVVGAVDGVLYFFGGESPSSSSTSSRGNNNNNTRIFYSREMYCVPVSYPFSSSLANLCSRWLAHQWSQYHPNGVLNRNYSQLQQPQSPQPPPISAVKASTEKIGMAHDDDEVRVVWSDNPSPLNPSSAPRSKPLLIPNGAPLSSVDDSSNSTNPYSSPSGIHHSTNRMMDGRYSNRYPSSTRREHNTTSSWDDHSSNNSSGSALRFQTTTELRHQKELERAPVGGGEDFISFAWWMLPKSVLQEVHRYFPKDDKEVPTSFFEVNSTH